VRPTVRGFARQGHVIGTVDWPMLVDKATGWGVGPAAVFLNTSKGRQTLR
jgi:hypothetical protein